ERAAVRRRDIEALKLRARRHPRDAIVDLLRKPQVSVRTERDAGGVTAAAVRCDVLRVDAIGIHAPDAPLSGVPDIAIRPRCDAARPGVGDGRRVANEGRPLDGNLADGARRRTLVREPDLSVRSGSDPARLARIGDLELVERDGRWWLL